MANVKITDLAALTNPASTDVLPIVDVGADVTKKVSVGEVVGKITGDVEVATDGTATISELPVSKLQDGDARQLLQTDAAGTGVEWTDNVDVPGTLDVTGAATLDSTLDVDGQSTLTSAAVSDLTEDRVVIAGASGELEDSANLTFDGSELGVIGTLDVSSDATIGGDLTVVGDLTVEGTTTTLETQTVTVEDKNIELGVVDTPTDTTADGGGLTLKGSTDKTINWIDATDAWTFSEHIDIASAKEFRIAGTKVLDATTLGSGVVNSSLTSVGTIATGTWQGTAIDDTYLDTISTAGKVSNSATTATDANTANAIVARDASGNFTAGTITADRVGLGTSSPSSTLAIQASGTQVSLLSARANAGSGGGMVLQTDASDDGLLRLYDSAGAIQLQLDTDGGDNYIAKGNIGINVASPSSLLHIADAGDITVGTTTGTKIGTATSQKIGFYNATPVVQPTAVADITTTATSGSLPTPDGSVTIADAATPTVTELLEYCVELEAKLEAALGHLRTLGLIAT